MHVTRRAVLVAAFALWLVGTDGGALRAAQQDAGATPRPMPSFPFRYSGRLEREGLPPLVALTRGADTLLVSVGDTIDSNYRLEEVDSQHIVVMHVPLKRKQTIALSDAPVGKPAEVPAEQPPAAPRTPLGTRGPACC